MSSRKKSKKSSSPKASSSSSNNNAPDASYLVATDVPTKQYIAYLNDLKAVDKKFIVQDLDSTHLLIKLSARKELEQKVQAWLDENVFSAVEKVGEDLDMS